MKLSDYQWSRNPRGMHNQGPMSLEVLQDQKMGIAKIVGLGADYVGFAARLMDYNITPIIRIYRPQHSGVPIDPEMMGQFQQYLQAGIKWFEIYNEPNLSIEWAPGRSFDPRNTAEVIAPICDNWLDWAERILDYGAYPGFIPLSEANGDWELTRLWIDQLLLYMFDRHYARFMQVVANGFWLPTHPYILNHFYQEKPGGGKLSQRHPDEQNYAEPGWHFEYPYDPISQSHDPGRSVLGSTPLAPLGDIHGLLGSGIAWLQRLQEIFDIGVVPVIGTEGGLWPMPERDRPQQLDARYHGFTWESHAHATQAMFDWISREAPPWMFGVALWKWDYYYDAAAGGPLAATTIFRETTPLPKDVPAIEVLSDYSILERGAETAENRLAPDVVLRPPGPGPIHGQADYHFIILAPGIEPEWFFTIARVYWERFKPTLMTIYDFINFLPDDNSLAATIITTPDKVDLMNDQIAKRWTNVYMDMIVVSETRQLEELLNSRVAVGRRFG